MKTLKIKKGDSPKVMAAKIALIALNSVKQENKKKK